jgi:hypothetical protein
MTVPRKKIGWVAKLPRALKFTFADDAFLPTSGDFTCFLHHQKGYKKNRHDQTPARAFDHVGLLVSGRPFEGVPLV